MKDLMSYVDMIGNRLEKLFDKGYFWVIIIIIIILAYWLLK